MALPFLARYGKAYESDATAYNEVANQLLIYAKHLKHASNGLLYHAYDEQGDPSWANPVTHRSPEFWGRSIGWYGMALVDVLDILPADHSQRAQLIKLVEGLVGAFSNFQDTTTGLWYQVVDKGSLKGNWLETSCSCMYVYIISKAIERGYVPAKTHAATGRKGFKGVLTQISFGKDGAPTLRTSALEPASAISPIISPVPERPTRFTVWAPFSSCTNRCWRRIGGERGRSGHRRFAR